MKFKKSLASVVAIAALSQTIPATAIDGTIENTECKATASENDVVAYLNKESENRKALAELFNEMYASMPEADQNIVDEMLYRANGNYWSFDGSRYPEIGYKYGFASGNVNSNYGFAKAIFQLKQITDAKYDKEPVSKTAEYVILSAQEKKVIAKQIVHDNSNEAVQFIETKLRNKLPANASFKERIETEVQIYQWKHAFLNASLRAQQIAACTAGLNTPATGNTAAQLAVLNLFYAGPDAIGYPYQLANYGEGIRYYDNKNRKAVSELQSKYDAALARVTDLKTKLANASTDAEKQYYTSELKTAQTDLDQVKVQADQIPSAVEGLDTALELAGLGAGTPMLNLGTKTIRYAPTGGTSNPGNGNNSNPGDSQSSDSGSASSSASDSSNSDSSSSGSSAGNQEGSSVLDMFTKFINSIVDLLKSAGAIIAPLRKLQAMQF